MSNMVNLEFPKHINNDNIKKKSNKVKIPNNNTFAHPLYKNADNISKTDIRYEAPKAPTNKYDVELYKLKIQQYQNEKGFKIAEYVGIGALIASVIGIFSFITFKSLK